MGCLKLSYYPDEGVLQKTPSALWAVHSKKGSEVKKCVKYYRWGFQGEYSEEDPETGWNSFELRMYDGVLGRFTTVDPAGYIGSPYLAMGNNPIFNVDPRGDTINVYSNSDPNFEGDILFSLNDGIDGIRNRTTQQLYDEGWQWTTPDAKNYANLIYVDRYALGKLGTKFFTVQDLVQFSLKVGSVEELFKHGKWLPADWKAVSDGANGDLVVFIDKRLYWADAVGQIPFGFNLSRFGYSPSKTRSLGNLFSDGYPNPFTSDGGPDRDFIMRGYLLNSRGRSVHHSVRKGTSAYSSFD